MGAPFFLSPVPPPKKLKPLRSRSSRVCAIIKLQFDFSIDLGLEEGENLNVVSQFLDESQSARIVNPPQLEKIWEGVISLAMRW
jgi:hypothetical protein